MTISFPNLSLNQSLSSLFLGKAVFDIYTSGSLNSSSSLLTFILFSFTVNTNKFFSGILFGRSNSKKSNELSLLILPEEISSKINLEGFSWQIVDLRLNNNIIKKISNIFFDIFNLN